MKLNKKGSLIDVVVWSVLAVITILVLGVLVFAFVTITNHLGAIGEVGNMDMGEITDLTFGQVTPNIMVWLPRIALIILVVSAFSILLHNFLVKAHPAFFITYFFMTIAGVVVSAYLSNQYMALLDNPTLGETLQTFVGANYIMQWLPYWVTVIGIFGAIFLFIGIIRDRQGGISV